MVNQLVEVSEEVRRALERGEPVVALETTVVVHGLPRPHNMETVSELMEICRASKVVPAIIGVVRGRITVGMTLPEIAELLRADALKVGTRELPYVAALGKNAATTVSATLKVASKVGIRTLATGGIGGVHVGDWDVSQDIVEMARTDGIVVSSGCKSILDVRKTLEFLETFQVLVVGYRTGHFPIFYEGLSEYEIEYQVHSPEEVVEVYKRKVQLGLDGTLLVANPIPPEHAIAEEEVSGYVTQALNECLERGISGKAVTPYLLSRIAELSGGRTVRANVELLKNNVALACEIAKLLAAAQGK